MGTIGQKVNQITIQRAVNAVDAHGGHETTWVTRCLAWAHERPLNGREAMQAAQVTAVLSSVWEIHYRADISVKDRVVFGTRTMEIQSVVDPKDNHAELWLYTSEVQP